MRSPKHTQPKVEDNTAEIVPTDWENVSNPDSIPEQPRSNNASVGSMPRRRRRGAKDTAAATATRNPVAKPECQRTPIMNNEEIEDAMATGAQFSVQYVFDAVSVAIRYMRRRFFILLFLWIFSLLVSRMTNVLRTALFPLCFIPGMSKSALCATVPPFPPQPDFPGLVRVQESLFDQLVGESVGGSALSVEILKDETATRDLSTLVRYSDFESRDSIADLLLTISMGA
ncbi:hypothetical protein EDD16DRAFT_142586 [Pisolithus croceorrhizus]|nr:hypothetical protein EDD16DRAFT_142586 [Pisolithus croceorrhizus]KAI6133445.1 hypothetical protein EV401DRAFT_89558 [Pisolithus croceorrhizus]KAI6165794.1 hypothetical protein EDD17DRAFT_1871511 [Pisolithus thermaeus]